MNQNYFEEKRKQEKDAIKYVDDRIAEAAERRKKANRNLKDTTNEHGSRV